jgi:hypothetical protein
LIKPLPYQAFHVATMLNRTLIVQKPIDESTGSSTAFAVFVIRQPSFRSRADGVSNASKLAGTIGGRRPSTRPGVYFVRRAGFHANPCPSDEN